MVYEDISKVEHSKATQNFMKKMDTKISEISY